MASDRMNARIINSSFIYGVKVVHLGHGKSRNSIWKKQTHGSLFIVKEENIHMRRLLKESDYQGPMQSPYEM